MAIVYVAHRLFGHHDRILGAQLAQAIADRAPTIDLFLPYCDTNEDSVVAEKKGLYLFQADMVRLRGLSAFAAILHGPGYDDGVCMEIGFAYAMNTPLVLMTTDFLTYSFAKDPRQFVFADPLLDVLDATVVHIPEPAPEGSDVATTRYRHFTERNAKSLSQALDSACSSLLRVLESPSGPISQPTTQKLVYIELSPYAPTDYPERLTAKAKSRGWDVYVAIRFLKSTEDVEEAARTDLRKALEAEVLVLDGNGPEVPAGSAVLAGIGSALTRTTLLYYAGSQVTHAKGREENVRNLMLLYGCSSLSRSVDELEASLDRTLVE